MSERSGTENELSLSRLKSMARVVEVVAEELALAESALREGVVAFGTEGAA